MKKILTMIVIGLLCMSMFSMFSPRANASNDLVGYWKFDEGSENIAQDSSGYGNSGIVHTATWTTGKVGNALHFNGVDSWVEVANSPTLTAFSQITLEAWIQEDVVTAELKGIISKCDGWAPPTNAEYFLGTNDNGRVFFETDNNVAIVGTQTDRLITQSGRWYYIAATWTGDSYAIYVDGQPVLTGTCTPQTTLSNTLPVQIGRHGEWSWVYFQGIIDEVKIYNYARTAEEVLADFNVNSGPVGYWKFDEGSDSTAYDSSGNDNRGTINGASWTTGVSDGALLFDGVNDYVGIADSPSLRLTSNQASLELWFKPTVTLDSTLTHRINILDKGNNYGFQMEPGARIFFTVWIGGNQWLGTVTTNWIAGKWYHIAGTYDGTTEKVYVNGILENSQSISGSLDGSSYPLSIGSYCLGTMNFFPGAIDEVKIYNSARTAEEIWNDYDALTKPDFEISVSPSPSILVHVGGSASALLTLKSINGFSGSIQLSSSGPSEAKTTVVFTQNPRYLSADDEVPVNIVINSYFDTSDSRFGALGEHEFVLSGTDGSIEHDVEVTIDLVPNTVAINNLVHFQQIPKNDPTFSVQQNFLIAAPNGEVEYWVQNIIVIQPHPNYASIWSAFQIFSKPNFAPGSQPWFYWVYWLPVSLAAFAAYRNVPFPVVLDLTSYLDGNDLVLTNTGSFAYNTLRWALPEGYYIVGYNGMAPGTKHANPEIAIVGWPSSPTAEFKKGTQGSVECSLKLFGEPTWSSTRTLIMYDDQPQTAERSLYLAWNTGNTFNYDKTIKDPMTAPQGVSFSPIYP